MLQKFLDSQAGCWFLKEAFSRAGVALTAIASQVAAHLVAWLGLAAFMPHDELARLSGSLELAIVMLGKVIMVILYALVVHRQALRGKILKQQLTDSDPTTPKLDLGSGYLGLNTLKAAEIVTGVPMGEAAGNALNSNAEIRRALSVDSR